ncbi:restriction endonuclease PLD domain-containing protein [Tetragenococcus halophilus]|uniref:restriction endonuclease PLD domain-containing protein n=1 Tax=Tetragenococcus halophilus TaxID=51669 RepID=UPI00209B8BEB|nr:restriction endonuclease PLD domain-containing protein [Tetragenococcus halophilus]
MRGQTKKIMSVWSKYEQSQKEQYILFLKVYGALSNLFRQKHGNAVPYLDSKFQETVYARSFNSENVDIGNTPHDILSVFGNERVGIGLKTWMGTSPSFQKVMQLKRYKNEIDPLVSNGKCEELANKLSNLKNDRMKFDYERLGLSKEKNIYHYVTRDEGKFVLQESSYPLVDLDRIRNYKLNKTSFIWEDGTKKYKYTFADSQIWQLFSKEKQDTTIIDQIDIQIIDDPFEFLIQSYIDRISEFQKEKEDIYEVYLPLYSYTSGEVQERSGLNAWNGAPKSKGSGKLRPLNEVYVPIPIEFHKKFPDFFTNNITEYLDTRKNKPDVRFYLQLPNGDRIPALVTQDNMKALQSGSKYEQKENGKLYGQSDLGQWLLVDVLGLDERKLVTREWLEKRGTDSIRLWRKKGDYDVINIDFAPTGSFDKFMNNEEIVLDE